MPPAESLENDLEPGKNDALGKPWKAPSPEELDLNTAGTTQNHRAVPESVWGTTPWGSRGHQTIGDTVPLGTPQHGGPTARAVQRHFYS